MNKEYIKTILVLMTMKFLLLIQVVYSLKSCHTCLWVRKTFPKKYKCSYFDKPVVMDMVNCTTHKLKNIDW